MEEILIASNTNSMVNLSMHESISNIKSGSLIGYGQKYDEESKYVAYSSKP